MDIKKVTRPIKAILYSQLIGNILFRKYFLKRIAEAIKPNASVLELGAGKFTYLNLIKQNFHKTAIDISENAINHSKEQGIYNDYILGDVTNLQNYIADKSFDTIVAFDLIEHVTKEQGLELLKNIEKIAKHSVVIYTPNGFLPQGEFDNNPFQKHLSGWDFEEMEKLGYKVYGINGLKSLRGEYALPTIKPRFIGYFLSNWSWIFLELFGKPQRSFAILCIKKLNEK